MTTSETCNCGRLKFPHSPEFCTSTLGPLPKPPWWAVVIGKADSRA